MIALIALVTGVWAGLVLYLYLLLRHSRRLRSDRLRRSAAPPTPGGRTTAVPLELGRLLRRTLPDTWVARVRRDLQATGQLLSVEQFLGQWAVLTLSWYVVISALALSVPLPAWLTLLALGLVLVAPFLQLTGRVTRRRERMAAAFPFLLDFLNMTVEAGLSLESGLVRAADQMRGPLGAELQRYVHNVRRGMTRQQALVALADAIGLPAVRAFVQMLVQSETFGLPVVDFLRAQAEQFREERRLLAEETAQRLPVKLLFPLVAFIFPTIFILILGPALIWMATNLALPN